MCPWIGKLIPWAIPRTFCCHCLLIETNDRLILVDTGLGKQDCDRPARLGFTHKLFRFQLRPEETAIHQLKALGYQERDLSDIVLTHLDSDHASGLCDFPNAQVHVATDSLDDAMSARSFHHKLRYRPHYLQETNSWSLVDTEKGESWMGFDNVQESPFGPEVLLVSLPGHTPGHLGVAVKREDGWLLHAGDAYYDQSLMTEGRNQYRLLSFFEGRAHFDVKTARQTVKRLQALPHEVEVVCSHDASYFGLA